MYLYQLKLDIIEYFDQLRNKLDLHVEKERGGIRSILWIGDNFNRSNAHGL